MIIRLMEECKMKQFSLINRACSLVKLNTVLIIYVQGCIWNHKCCQTNREPIGQEEAGSGPKVTRRIEENEDIFGCFSQEHKSSQDNKPSGVANLAQMKKHLLLPTSTDIKGSKWNQMNYNIIGFSMKVQKTRQCHCYLYPT